MCVCDSVQDKRPELGSESIMKLLEEVDRWIPVPERDLDKPFLFPIEDTFSIAGRGTVATGRVERGVIKKGTTAEIVGHKAKIRTTITGVLLIRAARRPELVPVLATVCHPQSVAWQTLS